MSSNLNSNMSQSSKALKEKVLEYRAKREELFASSALIPMLVSKPSSITEPKPQKEISIWGKIRR